MRTNPDSTFLTWRQGAWWNIYGQARRDSEKGSGEKQICKKAELKQKKYKENQTYKNEI